MLFGKFSIDFAPNKLYIPEHCAELNNIKNNSMKR